MTDANGLVSVRHGQVTKVGWVPPAGEMSSEQWLELGQQLVAVDRSMQWIIGDWWAYGADRKYGDGEALAEAIGIDYGTVRVYASIARSYEMLTRVNNLSFKHHRIVAGRDDRAAWLNRAELEGWSCDRLMSEIKAVEQTAEAAEAAGSNVTAQQVKDAVATRTTVDGETVVEVDGEGIVLGDPDLVPTPEVPPIVKHDLGNGVSHPARYSAAILERFEKVIDEVCNLGTDHIKVLDPFAGTGKIHELPFDTTGVELEPEWGQLVAEGNIIGDAAAMPFDDHSFDVVATSPTYGNRLADHHEAADPHLRRSYTHDLGRRLTPGNTGEIAWGPKYEEAHTVIWAEVRRVLKPFGWLLLNIKDHIKDGEQQPVSHWHTAALVGLGFTFWPGYSSGVTTQHLRVGSNSEQRAGQELVLVFRRGND